MIIQVDIFNLYYPEISSKQSQMRYSFLRWHKALKLLFNSLA